MFLKMDGLNNLIQFEKDDKTYEFEKDFIIWFKGYFFVKDKCFEGIQAAKYIFDKYNEKSNLITYINTMNGIFTCIVINKKINETLLFNDRFGFGQIFYYIDDNILILSDDFWKVKELSGCKNMDAVSLIELLKYRFVTNQYTLIENIHQILPASLYSFKIYNGQVKNSRIQYWKYNFCTKTISKSEAEEKNFLILNDIIKKYINLFPKSKFGVNLTGGLDSRLILTLLLENNIDHNNLETFTFGTDLCEDIKISDKVAKFCKVKHFKEIFGNEFLDFFQSDLIDKLVRINGFTTYYFQSYGYKRLADKSYYDNIDYLLTGDCGFIVGLTTNEQVQYINTKEDLIDLIYKKSATMLSDNDISKILKSNNNFNFNYEEKLKKRILERINSYDCNDYEALYFMWNQENRERKYCLTHYEIYNKKTKILYPFYDYEYMDFMLSLPYEFLNNQVIYINSIYKHVFTGKYEGLSKIATDQRGIFKIRNNNYVCENIHKNSFVRKLVNKFSVRPDDKYSYPIFKNWKESNITVKKYILEDLNNDSNIFNIANIEKLINKNKNSEMFFRYGLIVILTAVRFEKMIYCSKNNV